MYRASIGISRFPDTHVGIPSLCWNNTKALGHSVLRVAVVIPMVNSRSDVISEVVSRTGGLFDWGGGACDMAKNTWVNTNHFWKFILFLELHFLEIHGGFFFWNSLLHYFETNWGVLIGGNPLAVTAEVDSIYAFSKFRTTTAWIRCKIRADPFPFLREDSFLRKPHGKPHVFCSGEVHRWTPGSGYRDTSGVDADSKGAMIQVSKT